LDELFGITHELGRQSDPKTFVPTVPVVQSLRSVQAARTGTLLKFTRDRSRYSVGFSTMVLFRIACVTGNPKTREKFRVVGLHSRAAEGSVAALRVRCRLDEDQSSSILVFEVII
jgi:hypothetical protein